MKKTIITLLVVAAVVITVIIIALADSSRRIHQGNDNEWLKLKEIAAITDFFDASINKMILREGVTSPEWIVFDDVDLISDWNFFFDNAEVKQEGKAMDNNSHSINGDGTTVFVTAINDDGKKLSFSAYYDDSNERRMVIGGVVYTVKDSPGLPFKGTYWRALERHGVTTPWD